MRVPLLVRLNRFPLIRVFTVVFRGAVFSCVVFRRAVLSCVVFRGASSLELSRTQSGTPPSNVLGNRIPKRGLERRRAAFSAVAAIKHPIL